MNIFCTDLDPVQCAKDHCLVHQTKMILEYAQLLSTAHRVLDGDGGIQGIYSSTHENHPCAVWVRESDMNYLWLHEVAMVLCELYTDRTGKVHATQSILLALSELPKGIPSGDFTEPPICAPYGYRTIHDTVRAYRAYLNHKFSEWQARENPVAVSFWKAVPSWVRLEDTVEHVQDSL